MGLQMKLVNALGVVVKPGDRLTSSNKGDIYAVIDPVGRPPQHEGSTGRIYVVEDGVEYDGIHSREFFPGVFDCKWEQCYVLDAEGLGKIRDGLLEWSKEGPPSRKYGICGNLHESFPEAFADAHSEWTASYFMRELLNIRAWEHDTGNEQFPIPVSPNPNRDNWVGGVGDLRRDLCANLAETLNLVIADINGPAYRKLMEAARGNTGSTPTTYGVTRGKAGT